MCCSLSPVAGVTGAVEDSALLFLLRRTVTLPSRFYGATAMNEMICPECAHSISNYRKWCTECGHPIERKETAISTGGNTKVISLSPYAAPYALIIPASIRSDIDLRSLRDISGVEFDGFWSRCRKVSRFHVPPRQSISSLPGVNPVTITKTKSKENRHAIHVWY